MYHPNLLFTDRAVYHFKSQIPLIRFEPSLSTAIKIDSDHILAVDSNNIVKVFRYLTTGTYDLVAYEPLDCLKAMETQTTKDVLVVDQLTKSAQNLVFLLCKSRNMVML